MDRLVPDIRDRVFIMIDQVGRATCCSVSVAWHGYAIDMSMRLNPQPHLYASDKDPADFTSDELAALFSDYHLLCRVKPEFLISAYTACAGGSVPVAVFLMIKHGALKKLADTNDLVLDYQGYSDVYNGAFRSGNPAMIRFARLITGGNTEDIRWNTDDVVLGGKIAIDEWVSCTKCTERNYSNLFASACKLGIVDIITYVYGCCVAAGNKYVQPERPQAFVVPDFNFADVNGGIDCGVNGIGDVEDDEPLGIPVIRPYWQRKQKDEPKIPIVSVSASDIYNILPVDLENVRIQTVTPDVHQHTHYGQMCNYDPGQFNIRHILAGGLMVAVKNKNIDVVRLIATFTKNAAQTQVLNDKSMVIFKIIGEHDDVEFLDEFINTKPPDQPTPPPFGTLLALSIANCEHVVREMWRRAKADPATAGLANQIQAMTNGPTSDPLELAMLAAAASGNLLTTKTLLSEYEQPPTTRQLNKYMSMVCDASPIGIDVSFFRKLGATMCVCGNTH